MQNMVERRADAGGDKILEQQRTSCPEDVLKLSGVTETAMITLWARAQEAQHPNPLFVDSVAVEWKERLKYDFRRFSESWKTQTSIAIRTWILDNIISEHMRKFPESVILNLGSGFDSRFWRLDNGSILWYDIDLPPVIEIKKRLVEKTGRYRMIGKSILDLTWLDELESGSRPTTIIAEGVLMYMQESEISAMFQALVRAFPGADMFLELLAPAMVDSLYHDTHNTMDAGFKWSVLHGRDLGSVHAKLRFIDEWCVLDYFRERWNWIGRYADMPMFRNYFGEKIVHLKFR